jgi:hypothetical protein
MPIQCGFATDRPQKDGAEARFNLQQVVAAALSDGPSAFEAFEPGALDRPAYATLRASTTVAADPTHTAADPAHFGARVMITKGDTTIAHTITDAWGDSENSSDDDAVADKFDSLAAWAGIPADTTSRLRNAALSAESGQSAARLNELLTALQSGEMACTCLFKDGVFPIIRFSTHDVSAFRTDKSPMGLTLRRIAGLQGRGDNMAKLRGINIYPTGLSVILTESDPQPLHA